VEQSLAIAREIGDRRSECGALSRLGQVALLLGRLDEATSYLEQSLANARESSDRRWEARNLCVLGQVAEARDDLARAETLYQGSLTIAIERGLGQELAEAQLALGRLLAERLARLDEGRSLLLESAQRYSEMGMPEAEEARAAVERLS
jgi:tetratricopeptide (TPR) repeat protein